MGAGKTHDPEVCAEANAVAELRGMLASMGSGERAEWEEHKARKRAEYRASLPKPKTKAKAKIKAKAKT